MVLYSQKLEPLLEIGQNMEFYGGSSNKLNLTSDGKRRYFVVQDIIPLPEYYLQFFQNTNASPVISSLAPSTTVIYNGNDLQLPDLTFGQFRFAVITSSLQVSVQYGKSAGVLYKTLNATGFVDANNASTLYGLTEFYVFQNIFPSFYLNNVGTSTLTSAYIVVSGFMYTLESVSGTPTVKRVIPQLKQ
ncbi:MAG: hypothetical protein QXP38_00600 [Nitrososphaerota archaeon]